MKVKTGINLQYTMEAFAGLFVYHGFGGGIYWYDADTCAHLTTDDARQAAEQAGIDFQYQHGSKMPFNAQPRHRIKPFMTREALIGQLRHALHLAESPQEYVLEFEIGDYDFCFEFGD